MSMGGGGFNQWSVLLSIVTSFHLPSSNQMQTVAEHPWLLPMILPLFSQGQRLPPAPQRLRRLRRGTRIDPRSPRPGTASARPSSRRGDGFADSASEPRVEAGLPASLQEQNRSKCQVGGMFVGCSGNLRTQLTKQARGRVSKWLATYAAGVYEFLRMLLLALLKRCHVEAADVWDGLRVSHSALISPSPRCKQKENNSAPRRMA